MPPKLFFRIAALTKVVQKSPETDWHPFAQYQKSSYRCLSANFWPTVSEADAIE